MFRLKGTCMNAATVEKEVDVRELRPATQLLFACLHVVFFIIILIYYFICFYAFLCKTVFFSSSLLSILSKIPEKAYNYCRISDRIYV